MRRQQKNKTAPAAGSRPRKVKTQLEEVTVQELRLLKLVRKMVAAEVADAENAHICSLLKLNYRVGCLLEETPLSS